MTFSTTFDTPRRRGKPLRRRPSPEIGRCKKPAGKQAVRTGGAGGGAGAGSAHGWSGRRGRRSGRRQCARAGGAEIDMRTVAELLPRALRAEGGADMQTQGVWRQAAWAAQVKTSATGGAGSPPRTAWGAGGVDSLPPGSGRRGSSSAGSAHDCTEKGKPPAEKPPGAFFLEMRVCRVQDVTAHPSHCAPGTGSGCASSRFHWRSGRDGSNPPAAPHRTAQPSS